jgi:hypothetical protein
MNMNVPQARAKNNHDNDVVLGKHDSWGSFASFYFEM